MRLLPTKLLRTGLLVLTAAFIAGSVSAWEAPPKTPPAPDIVRIYYDKITDLDKLFAYDLFEVNNLEEGYVLAAVQSYELKRLRALGWAVAYDNSHSLKFDRALYNGGYRTVDELYMKINELSQQFPTLTEIVSYGQSYCKTRSGCETPGGEETAGYELLAMRVTNEAFPGSSSVGGGMVKRGQKPVFFILANIHARELTTPEIAMRWLELLLEQYGTDPDITWLVDHHEMWIVPTANPDGHWITELGVDPLYGGYPLLHRKNFDRDADQDGVTDCDVWPPGNYSQFGVDLNRNHSFGWLAPGSPAAKCSLTYSGPTAASEPETAALQELVRGLFADSRGPGIEDPAGPQTSGILFTLHNYSELILRPWGHLSAPSPDEEGLKAIGDKLAAFNGYRSCRPPECLYSAHGTTDDWAYGELGIPAFTFEIGTNEQGFSPPYSVIDAEQWPKNRDAFLYAALLARRPYELIQGPDITRFSAAQNSFDGSVTVTAEFDDGDHGGQTITGAEYSIDIPFWESSAGVREMSLTSSDPENLVATFSAQPELAGLARGRHAIFVRGTDSAGYTGITRSLFFTVEDPLQPVRSTTYIPVLVGQ